MLGTSILIVTLIHVSTLRLQDESIITARLPRTVLHCFVWVQHSPWPILTPFAWSSSIFNKVTDEKMERSTQNPPWFSLLELTAKVLPISLVAEDPGMSRFEEGLRNALNAQRGNSLLRAYFGALSTTEAEGFGVWKKGTSTKDTYFSIKNHQNVLKATFGPVARSSFLMNWYLEREFVCTIESYPILFTAPVVARVVWHSIW